MKFFLLTTCISGLILFLIFLFFIGDPIKNTYIIMPVSLIYSACAFTAYFYSYSLSNRNFIRIFILISLICIYSIYNYVSLVLEIGDFAGYFFMFIEIGIFAAWLLSFFFLYKNTQNNKFFINNLYKILSILSVLIFLLLSLFSLRAFYEGVAIYLLLLRILLVIFLFGLSFFKPIKT